MDYKVTDTELTSIANAIRTKGGTSQPLTFPNEFITAVENIPTGGGTLQTKTKSYTPTESAQTETIQADSGYNGLSSVAVSVGAIALDYVGSNVTRRTSTDLTVSGKTVTAPSGFYSASASKSVADGTEGTPTATKGTVSNHSVSVTPSVTNTAGYISGGTKSGTAVTVSASELVSGSETKTENGTYDVTNLAELIVNVEGGASNFVQGEFHSGTTTTAQTVNIPYTGNGYPIMAYVVIKGGAYISDTEWYTTIHRYAVGVWSMSKNNMSLTPSFATSGAENQAVTTWIYKSSTSSATSYSRSSAMNTNTFSSSNASSGGATCVRFKSATKLSVVASTTSYGLFPDTDYQYFIVYSE